MPLSYLNTIFKDILEEHNISWRSELQWLIHLPSSVEFDQVKKENDLKVLYVHPDTDAHNHGTVALPDLGLLHRRLAHLHINGIWELLKQQGVELFCTQFPPCDTYALAKSPCIIYQPPHSRA